MATTVETMTVNAGTKQRNTVSEKLATLNPKHTAVPTQDEKREQIDLQAQPRANVAATREAPAATTKDKYGYISRKKTVSYSGSCEYRRTGH